MYVVLQAKDVQILPVSDLWMFIDIWGRVLGRRVGPSQKTLVHKGGGKRIYIYAVNEIWAHHPGVEAAETLLKCAFKVIG